MEDRLRHALQTLSAELYDKGVVVEDYEAARAQALENIKKSKHV